MLYTLFSTASPTQSPNPLTQRTYMKVSGLFMRTKGEGEATPFWYGLAYRDFARDVYILLPIPINIIVRVAREIYWACVRLWRNDIEDRIAREAHKAFLNGKMLRQEMENNRMQDALTDVLNRNFDKIWNGIVDAALREDRTVLETKIRQLEQEIERLKAP